MYIAREWKKNTNVYWQ